MRSPWRNTTKRPPPRKKVVERENHTAVPNDKADHHWALPHTSSVDENSDVDEAHYSWAIPIPPTLLLFLPYRHPHSAEGVERRRSRRGRQRSRFFFFFFVQKGYAKTRGRPPPRKRGFPLAVVPLPRHEETKERGKVACWRGRADASLDRHGVFAEGAAGKDVRLSPLLPLLLRCRPLKSLFLFLGTPCVHLLLPPLHWHCGDHS